MKAAITEVRIERPAACLPAPDDYYRPTRARELGRKAEGLARWLRGLKMLVPLLLAGVLVPLALSTRVMGTGARLRDLVLISLGLGVAICSLKLLARRLARLRAGARALNRDHETLYGPDASSRPGAA